MKLSTCLAFLLASLLIGLDACHQPAPVPAQKTAPCALLSFLAINKSSDPNLARIREETVEIAGQQVRIGESSRIEYRFDAQNRPIGTAYSARGYSDFSGSSILAYSSGQLTVKTIYSSGGVEEVVFPLNERGLIADATYNADGFTIESGNDQYRTTYTIENGNIIRKETRAVADQSLFGTVLYEYDLNQPNLPNVEPYKGRNSQNLPVKETYINYSLNKDGPPVTTVYEYTYTFDSAGRPIRRFGKLNDGKVNYEVVDFAYTCRQ
ncbi:hypothetical protein ACFPMF_22160 [Larkinella bovis]|uniref:DUF4595 domain-containing protein n=1 Tax=Larkinella bovis TaxID=683041 RepID=A0ABW0IEY3_9BACT